MPQRICAILIFRVLAGKKVKVKPIKIVRHVKARILSGFPKKGYFCVLLKTVIIPSSKSA